MSMDTQVKSRDTIHVRAYKRNRIMKRVLLFLIAVVVLNIGNTAYAFFGSTDYTGMPVEKVAEQVKKLDSQIRTVEVRPMDGGKELLVMVFRAGVVRDPLLEESKDLRDIAEEITKAKGAERFGGIQFVLLIPVVDAKGNKSDAVGMALYWSMANLKGVNWKGFQNWQFLDIVDGFKLGPMGKDTVQSYCGAKASYSEVFCRRINAW